MKKLRYIISNNTNPYKNIALEACLLTHTEPEECMLYLWQNRKTVVIGCNQNAWKECRLEELEADGGFLARRLSGGGAVFHDMGNLNFTFLSRKHSYCVERQTEVILRAVQSFGIHAARTGRNDLVVDGRKFSGNAFYRTGDFCCHHGTILIRSDKQALSKYLNVSGEKLRSKGVDSVKSRVENLSEYEPRLTVGQMQAALLEAFAEVYEGTPQLAEPGEFPKSELREGEKRFSSWEWLYGRKVPFDFEITRRFCWGEVLVRLKVSEGMVQDVTVWTDALDTELPRRAAHVLTGCRYRKEDIGNVLDRIRRNSAQDMMLADIVECLCQIGGEDGNSI